MLDHMYMYLPGWARREEWQCHMMDNSNLIGRLLSVALFSTWMKDDLSTDPKEIPTEVVRE